MKAYRWCYSLGGNLFERAAATEQEALDLAWHEEFDDGRRPDEVWVGELPEGSEPDTVCGQEIIYHRDLINVQRQTLYELRNYPE